MWSLVFIMWVEQGKSPRKVTAIAKAYLVEEPATPEETPHPEIIQPDPLPGLSIPSEPAFVILPPIEIPSKPKLWEKFDISRAKEMGDFLRLTGSGDGDKTGMVTTKEVYTGQIEITLVARILNNDRKKQDFRIQCYGAMVILNWEGNPAQLRIHRLNGSLGTADVKPLTCNVWHKVVWQIKSKSMKVIVDGKQIFYEVRASKLDRHAVVSVNNAFDSVIDVASLTVKEIK